MGSLRVAVAAVFMALACAGCLLEILPMVGSAAVMGINYTAKNCPRRTFTCELESVHAAALEALESMSMRVIKDERQAKGYHVQAQADGLKVTVEMVQLTPTTTKIGVDAARNIILRDGATAYEIVAQVEQALRHRGVGVASEPPVSAASPAQEPHRPSVPPNRLTST